MSVTTTDTVQRYLDFWNAASAEAMRAAAAGTFAADVMQYAPVGVLTGVEGLVGFGTEFHEHMGAVTFAARHEPEAHHGRVRLPWELVLSDGTSFAEGTDVLVLDEEGRIRDIITFLDRPPAGFDPDAHA